MAATINVAPGPRIDQPHITRMKPETSTASPRTKKYLVSCLAALMAVSAPMGYAADSDALKKLQEENAALRKRLAALEGSARPPLPPLQLPAKRPVR